MGLQIVFTLSCAYIRNEGPLQKLRLTSSSGALVLFGYNSLGMNTYRLFSGWSSLESYLSEKDLSLPNIVEIAQLPPVSIEMSPIGADEGSLEYKILWSQNGSDRNVLHFPDLQSAKVFRDYVYFHGLESSHLGHSLAIHQN